MPAATNIKGVFHEVKIVDNMFFELINSAFPVPITGTQLIIPFEFHSFLSNTGDIFINGMMKDKMV
jgi:hypothetical protein